MDLNAHQGRPALLGLLLLLGLPAARAEEPAPNASVTVLEPVFVEASTGDPWIYFTVPGFEVISHCPESFNETYARALRRAAAARLAVLPAGFWGDMPTPMKIVLYDRAPAPRSGFARGSPIDLAWVAGGGSVGSGTVMRSFPVTVGDGDTYINCGNYWSIQTDSDDFSVDPDSAIRLEHRVPRLPDWFEAGVEGPRGIYPNSIIRPSAFSEALVLASATWVSPEETLALQNEAKEKRKDGKGPAPREMLPLGALFRGGAPAGKRELWNSEAALVVRWGLFEGARKQAFLGFVDAASREPATEDLFRRHLGFGYDHAVELLQAYLPKAVSEPVRTQMESLPPKPLEAREASSVEVARIIGDWGRLEGRSGGIENLDYQRECLDQADRLFQRIHLRRNSDPKFLAAYGLYKVQVGDDVEAREALESATGAGVVRPRAYVELARLRLDEALPSVQQGVGDLDRAEYAAITGLLTTARVQMPSLLATYDVLARVLEHAPSRPTREELRPLEEALENFPQNAPLAYKVANLFREVGYGDEAAAIVTRASRFSDSDESRSLLAEFLARKPK